MNRPSLGVFNEQTSDALEGTFTDATVETLASLGATVSMGLLDLTPERVKVVRRLSAAGVSVIGWLLTTRDEGYFATPHNAEATERAYERFVTWSRANQLSFFGVGLDFEPPLEMLERLMARPVRTAASWLFSQRPSFVEAKQRYTQLVGRMRSDGYFVEGYHLPLALIDRERGGDFWSRTLGTVDVQTDRDVVMLYSSVMGRSGRGVLESAAPHCRAIGVGSTGGGVDPFPKLSDEALARDVAIAASHASHVAIFSVEGLVARGSLERLRALPWTARPAATRHRALGNVLLGAARWLARP